MKTLGLIFEIVMYIIGGVSLTLLGIYWYKFIRMIVSFNKPVRKVKPSLEIAKI